MSAPFNKKEIPIYSRHERRVRGRHLCSIDSGFDHSASDAAAENAAMALYGSEKVQEIADLMSGILNSDMSDDDFENMSDEEFSNLFTEKIQVDKEDAEGALFTNHEWPYGLMGDLAKFVFNNWMEWPNKEIAIIAARHTIYTLQGRRGNLNGLKPQNHTVLIAPQAVGKETVITTLNNVIYGLMDLFKSDPEGYDWINIAESPFENMKGSRGAFGVKALVNRFGAAPSLSIILGEAGIAGKSDSGDLYTLKAFIMLNMVNAAYHPIDVKDYSQNSPPIYGTVFQFLEESTLDSYLHKFKTESLKNGVIARQHVSFVDPKLKQENVQCQEKKIILQRLANLVKYSLHNEDGTHKIEVGRIDFIGCSYKPVDLCDRVNFVLDDEASAANEYLRKDEKALRETRETYKRDDWAQFARNRSKILTEAFVYGQTEYGEKLATGCEAAPIITMEMFRQAYWFVRVSDESFKANFKELFSDSSDAIFEALVHQVDKIKKDLTTRISIMFPIERLLLEKVH